MANKRYSEHDILQQEVDTVEKRLIEVRLELASKTIKGKMLAMDEYAFGREVEEMHALLKVRREEERKRRKERTRRDRETERQRDRKRERDCSGPPPSPLHPCCCVCLTCAYLVKYPVYKSDLTLSRTLPFLLPLPPLHISPTLYH